MKYKTTIQIISEAADKNEAMEIAGEYLSGNIVSGVDMKCRTGRYAPYQKGAITAFAVSSLVVLFICSSVFFRNSQNSPSSAAQISAIQPPLKTAVMDRKNSSFKKVWEDERNREALARIKK